MICIMPPAVSDSLTDPIMTGLPMTLYRWCLAHLDFREVRSVKFSALPVSRNHVPATFATLEKSGYVRQPRPGMFVLVWSREELHSKSA